MLLLLRRLAARPRRALRAAGRGARACIRGLRSPAGRLGVHATLTLLAVAGAITVGWYVVPGSGPAWSYGTEPTTEESEAPLVLAPDAGQPAETGAADDATSPTDAATTEAATDLESWAQSLADLGIPERVLIAYGRAELVSATENPGCNLSWTTLAGIGATETNHGTTDGNRVQSDGTTLTPIRGAEYDEMGPMQFLPSTWEHWKADGDADGEYNPDDIDDAVTAAADYLCNDDRDLSTPSGWQAAVHSYNPRDDYVQKVFDRADEYGRMSTA